MKESNGSDRSYKPKLNFRSVFVLRRHSEVVGGPPSIKGIFDSIGSVDYWMGMNYPSLSRKPKNDSSSYIDYDGGFVAEEVPLIDMNALEMASDASQQLQEIAAQKHELSQKEKLLKQIVS